jgi:predicted secreted hydrolase
LVNPLRRRAWILGASLGGLLPRFVSSQPQGRPVEPDDRAIDDPVSPQRRLVFPRDHGAHPGSRIEWWYATGWLAVSGQEPQFGFQLTFFRSRTGLGEARESVAEHSVAQASGPAPAGRFAPRQLLFAHAAITQLRPGSHRHAQRIGRWSGAESTSGPLASSRDTLVRLGAWQLVRRDDAAASVYAARLAAPEAGFTLDLALTATQPLLLQGDQGYSLKGPPTADGGPPHASHYYSQPQLDAQGRLTIEGREQAVRGRAWLDHEWSDALMPPEAVGWDWVGIDLLDGGALTAFVMRSGDGRTLWAGGSHRPAGGTVRSFKAAEVRFTPLRWWTSPSTRARYPVQWRIDTPAGSHELEALLDAQELDSRGSTGAVYWEGLAELRGAGRQRAGLGYLEMTGYLGALKLG